MRSPAVPGTGINVAQFRRRGRSWPHPSSATMVHRFLITLAPVLVAAFCAMPAEARATQDEAPEQYWGAGRVSSAAAAPAGSAKLVRRSHSASCSGDKEISV